MEIIKENNKIKKFKFQRTLKWLGLALFLAAGTYVAVSVPAAVQSLLPVVNTVYPQKAEYRKTVQGSGLIYAENGFWTVIAAINESEIKLIKKGQQAVLNGAAFDDSAYTATVTGIADTAKQVQNASGFAVETVVEIVLEIKNPDSGLRSGYTTQAVISVEEPREVLVVPYEVICQDDESEYVYVLKGNSAVRRNITTGAELPEGAELISGLRETDEVVTEPENIGGSQLVRRQTGV